jgi:hypothetical protein
LLFQCVSRWKGSQGFEVTLGNGSLLGFDVADADITPAREQAVSVVNLIHFFLHLCLRKWLLFLLALGRLFGFDLGLHGQVFERRVSYRWNQFIHIKLGFFALLPFQHGFFPLIVSVTALWLDVIEQIDFGFFFLN